MRTNILFSLLVILCSCQLLSQKITPIPLFGNPYIQNYGPQDYNTGPQNWGGFQGDDGLVYIANNNRILVFDGSDWQALDKLNLAYVRAVCPRKEGGIYIAAHNDIGYFEPNQAHEFSYHSLLEYVPEEQRNYSYTLKIERTSDGVFFGTDKFLYRWQEGEAGNPGKMSVLAAGQNSSLCHAVNDEIYVRVLDVGLTKLVGDSLQLLPGGEFFSRRRIHFLLPWGGENGFSEEALLVGVPLTGLFIYDQGNVVPFELPPENEAFLVESPIINGIKLSNGNIAMACFYGGLMIMDPQGNFVQHITDGSGLRDANVVGVFEDKVGGIWACLNDGLAYIEAASPFSYYNEKQGLDMDLQCVISSQQQLYMGGDKGLYQVDLPGSTLEEVRFRPMEELSQMTLDLLPYGDEVLAAAVNGMYQIKGNQVTKINDAISTHLLVSQYDSTLLYVGLLDGVMLMKKFSSGWERLAMVSQLGGDFRTILEAGKGNVWAGFEKGFINFKFDLDSLSAVNEVPNEAVELKLKHKQSYTSFEGEDLISVNVFKLHDRIIFNVPQGILTYDSLADKLVRDSIFSQLYPGPSHGISMIQQDDEGDVWVESFRGKNKLIEWFDKKPTGEYQKVIAPFFRLKEMETVYDFYTNTQMPAQVWIAGTNGLVRFDKSKAFDTSPLFPPLIRKMSTLDDSVFYGGASAKRSDLSLPYSLNSLRFSFALPAFDHPASNQFQYKLEGFDQKWSKWSPENEKEYTNLPEGTYKFWIKARNVYQQEVESEAFAFSILPPWYRSWWAYLLYFVALIGGVWLLLKWRTQRLKEQNRELENIVKERTAEVIEAREMMFTQEKLASLGQMTVGIAHEIKNPLNFVNNFAEGSKDLADEMAEGLEPYWEKISEKDVSYLKEIIADIRENASSIHRNGLRADEIINAMMRHTEKSSGQPAAVNMNHLIKESLDLVTTGLQTDDQQASIDFQLQLASDLPEIQGIPQELVRVLINIFQNAIYALKEKAKLAGDDFKAKLLVESAYNEKEIWVKIRDNGTGIKQELLQEIFSPFFTTKPPGQGNTGLGLSISYDIITQGHKGKLEVHSEEGMYSAFKITLPQ